MNAPLLLRLGLAFVFLYAGIMSFLNPSDWTGYFPLFLRNLVNNDALLLNIHSLAEVLLAIWLLSGKWLLYASLAASVALFSIFIFNVSLIDIVFRDIGLLFSALALALLSYERKNKTR